MQLRVITYYCDTSEMLTFGQTASHSEMFTSQRYFLNVIRNKLDLPKIFSKGLHISDGFQIVRFSCILMIALQNRGHAEVLKKDPFFREIRNAVRPPSVPECPPPPPPRDSMPIRDSEVAPEPGKWWLISPPILQVFPASTSKLLISQTFIKCLHSPVLFGVFRWMLARRRKVFESFEKYV